MKKLMFDDDVKSSLIRGTELINRAVETTFGPKGRNVIIKNLGGVHVTKDGMTVASHVNSEDPFEQVAVDIIKELSQKTAKDVGDGTTTCVLLTYILVMLNKDKKDIVPGELQRVLQEDCAKVVKYLEAHKKEITTFDEIKKVATLSANNDEKLGTLIAEAYNQVGKYGIVNIQESRQCEDYYEVSKGMQLENGYASPFFINTKDNTCELDNVLVHITQDKIETNKQFLPLAEKAIKEGKSLLVVATDMDTFLQEAMIQNSREHRLDSCFVKMPHHGRFKDMFIEDVKRILGTSMTCEKVIITKDNTTFIGCHTDQDNEEYIKDIEHQLTFKELAPAEEKIYTKRLANFKGGICTIKVGGYAETEIREKKDRIEDAVCATKSALLYGILPGGGTSLLQAYKNVEVSDYFKDALIYPFKTLCKNCNKDIKENEITFDRVYNFKTEEFGDMIDIGVIEPFMVTKTALENAVSAASLILTSGCSIINM